MWLIMGSADVVQRFHQVAVGWMNALESSGAKEVVVVVVVTTAVIVAITATNSGLVSESQRLAASEMLATAFIRAILSPTLWYYYYF